MCYTERMQSWKDFAIRDMKAAGRNRQNFCRTVEDVFVRHRGMGNIVSLSLLQIGTLQQYYPTHPGQPASLPVLWLSPERIGSQVAFSLCLSPARRPHRHSFQKIQSSSALTSSCPVALFEVPRLYTVRARAGVSYSCPIYVSLVFLEYCPGGWQRLRPQHAYILYPPRPLQIMVSADRIPL